jgi:hypothetical protein
MPLVAVTPAARQRHTIAPVKAAPHVYTVTGVAGNMNVPHVGTATLPDGTTDEVVLWQGRPVTLAVFQEGNPGYNQIS